MENMTALVSCFVRAYHNNYKYKIYSDSYAFEIIKDEYNMIADNMSNGINYFNPNFKGTKEEALRFIVDNQLSPTVLGRSAFCKKSLERAIGCKQYLIYASGYDTSGYDTNFNVFEIDKKEIIEDKKLRTVNIKNSVNYIECDFTKDNLNKCLSNSSYNKNEKSFNSLLGISYYLTKKEFNDLIKNISNIVVDGSTIVFDYPTIDTSKEISVNESLASGANEIMKSKYSYEEMERMLSNHGFLVYEHLNNEEMNREYFSTYNTLNPEHQIKCPQGVSFCLAVKKIVV